MRTEEKINLVFAFGLIGFVLYSFRNFIKPNN